MTVGFKRWLRRRHAAGRISVAIASDVIAPLLYAEFTLYRSALAATALRVETYRVGENERRR